QGFIPMQTLVLRIDDLDDHQGGYRVSLRSWPQDQELLLPSIMPANLTPPGLPTALSAQAMLARFTGAVAPHDALCQICDQLDALLALGALGPTLQAAPHRVVLDIRARPLQALPWELLRRAHDQFPRFGDEQSPFSRGTLTSGPPLAPHGWPLRL